MLNPFTKKCIAALLAVSVAGCTQVTEGIETVSAAYNIDPELTPEEQALVEESGAIVQRSIIEGAAIGAVVGCGLGLLVSRSRLLGCAVGAGSGLLAGGLAGAAVGQGNVDAKTTLDNEDKRIAELQEEQQRLDAFGKKLRAQIKAQNQELRTLKTQLSRNEIQAATYRTKYRRIQSFRNKVNASLTRDIETLQSEKTTLAQQKEAGVNVSRVEPKVDANLDKLRTLAKASSEIAPPAVPLEEEV